MAKIGKRTKKFQKKHLDGELRRRRATKIKKQREATATRRARARGSESDDGDDDDGDEDEEDEETPMDGKKRIEDMSIDEFLNQSDFDDDDGDEEEEEESEESEEEESEDEEVSDEDDDEEEEEEEVSDEDDDDDLKAIERANEKMGGEIRAHKEALGKLKETDPEFYEFLREEDSELLDFDEVSDDEDEDEDDLSDDEDDTTARKKAKKRTLTTEIVKKLCENAEGGESLAGAKALFQAYRSACHYGDDENDGDEASVRLASSSAFHELVQYTLTNADGILRGLLGVESRDDDDDAFKPHANARWKKVQPLAKSYIGNTLHLLGNLTDAEMTAMVIRQLKTVTPFMATFERLTKRVTRSALHCFGSGEPSVRVQAILLLRAMAVGLPPPSLERVAKGVYRTFASNAKFLNAESVEHIVFMSTCVVEIFGLDQQQSYPLAFTYIRQLASLLRGALTAKSKEAFRNVYCWQYVNCLECWERVLSTHAKDEDAPLRPLVYPLAQVALGAARLLPSARYAPLRLRLVALLNRLSVSTGRFIPVAPLLMELLTFSELTKPPVSSKSHPPDFTIVLRLAKQDLRVPGVQDVIVESSMEALAEHLHQNAYSPAFPELAHIPTRELKKFCKTVSVTRFKKAAKAVIDAAERTSDWMIRKRDNVDFAPKDLDKVANFLAAERAEGKAPMSRLAKQLHEKAEQRVAAQQAVDVKLTRGQKASTGASDSEDEEHEEDTADDDHREDDVVGDEDDDEDDFAAKSDDDSDSDVVIDGDEAYAEHKKRKSRAGDHDSLQGDDDVVEDFQLSSSDDDDEEEDRSRRKKQSSSKKKRRQ